MRTKLQLCVKQYVSQALHQMLQTKKWTLINCFANKFSKITFKTIEKHRYGLRKTVSKHLNNATSDALFHGGHLVMRSKRWAIQNQRITLKMCLPRSIIKFPRLTSFPRGSSVCRPFFCRYSIQFASFLAIAGNCKSHSKLVNACWLWWITRGIWGNQIPKNILNEWYAFGLR